MGAFSGLVECLLSKYICGSISVGGGKLRILLLCHLPRFFSKILFLPLIHGTLFVHMSGFVSKDKIVSLKPTSVH